MDTEALKIRKWAENGDRTDPDSSSLNPALNRAVGWTQVFSREGGENPRREVFNQMLRELTGFAVDVREHGVLEWSALQDYEPGAIVQHNGQLWRVGSRNGPSTLVVEPGTDTNVWATTARTVSAPGVPPNPSGTAGQGQVTWSWGCPLDNGAIITGFEYQTRASGEAWGTVTAITASILLQTGLTNGTTYQFRIRAVNAQGNSDWSATASSTPAATVPGQVIGVVGFGDEDSIEIHWAEPDAGGSNIVGYLVQWRTAAGTFTTQNQVQVTDRDHTVQNLPHSTAYEFRVRAINGIGNGQWSDTISESTAAEFVAPVEVPAAPGTPDGIAGTTSITWRWLAGKDNGASITGYEVEWRISGDTWSAARRTSVTYGYWEQTGLTTGTNYQIRVRAINSQGSSPWSSTGGTSTGTITAAQTPAALPAPSSMVCTGSAGTEIVWSWSLPSFPVTGFDFQWRVTGQPWAGNTETVTGTVATTTFPNDTDTVEGRIRAKNIAGNGAWSPAAGADPADGEQTAVPPGTIIDFGGSTAPSGYLECNGAAVSRTTYSRLYTAIGDTWGQGDGNTTFNLPNLQRRTAIGKGGASSAVIGNAVGNVGGAEIHTLVEAELPAHNHPFTNAAITTDGRHSHHKGSLAIGAAGEHYHEYNGQSIRGGNPTPEDPINRYVNDTGGRTDTSRAGGHQHEVTGSTGRGGHHTHAISGNTDSVGSGGSHTNVQPSAVVIKVIRT